MLERPIYRRLEPSKDIIKRKYWGIKALGGLPAPQPCDRVLISSISKNRDSINQPPYPSAGPFSQVLESRLQYARGGVGGTYQFKVGIYYYPQDVRPSEVIIGAVRYRV